jgi:hypothetical protein
MNDPIKKAAAMLGRKGGRVKSEAKAEAVRANGRRGGRPSTKPYRIERRDGRFVLVPGGVSYRTRNLARMAGEAMHAGDDWRGCPTD